MHHFNRIIQTLADISLGAAGAIAISGALAGCGASGEDISDSVEIVDGGALGSLEQGMSSKFSSVNTYGVKAAVGDRRKCTVANGGNGFKCRMPTTKALKFTVTGAEGVYPFDWQYETRRMAESIIGTISPSSWTLPKYVTDGTHNVTFSVGTCPGLSTSESVSSFVCTDWSSDTQLAESLNGSYYKWTTGMTVKIDQTKISARCGASDGCKHWIQEHGLAASWIQAFGEGMIHISNRAATNLFDDDFVEHSLVQGAQKYDFAGMSAEAVCRVKSYETSAQAQFIKQAGGC